MPSFLRVFTYVVRTRPSFLIFLLAFELYFLRTIIGDEHFYINKYVNFSNTILIFLGIGISSFILELFRDVRLRMLSENSEQRLSLDLFGATAEERLSTQFDRIMNSKIEESIGKIAKISKSDIEKKLRDEVKHEIGENAVEYIGEQIARKSHKYSINRQLKLLVDEFTDDTTRFLKAKADASSRRAFMYTFASISFATFGVLVLCYNLYLIQMTFNMDIPTPSDMTRYEHVFARYIPSFSIALLSEFLALVMQKAHTRSMEYLRYFLNEKTNINARRLAIIAALETGNTQMTKKFIDFYLQFERNTVLSDKQKTLEISSMEVENSFYKSIIPNISPFSKSNPQESRKENENGQRTRRRPSAKAEDK